MYWKSNENKWSIWGAINALCNVVVLNYTTESVWSSRKACFVFFLCFAFFVLLVMLSLSLLILLLIRTLFSCVGNIVIVTLLLVKMSLIACNAVNTSSCDKLDECYEVLWLLPLVVVVAELNISSSVWITTESKYGSKDNSYSCAIHDKIVRIIGFCNLRLPNVLLPSWTDALSLLNVCIIPFVLNCSAYKYKDSNGSIGCVIPVLRITS